MKKILLLGAALLAAMTSMAEVTLYYVNSNGWESVNAYVWPTGGEGIVKWPGAEATKTGETAKGSDVYSYTFDETAAQNIIFNDGTNQTDDMTFDASKPYCYGGEWYASIEEIEGAGELPTYNYYIAGAGVEGSEFACGKTWSVAGCGLVDNTVTYASLPAGEYQFKITNGTWGSTLGFAELTNQEGFSTIEEGDGANNIIFTLDAPKSVTISTDGSSVTVTINGEGGDDNTGDDTGDDNTGDDDPIDTPTGADYYLIGYINGANYGCEEDYENMGDYKFVDGSVTATFDIDSYVFVKTEGNGAWFMSEGFAEESPATLINTNEGLTDANKLKVPGGVEVTFTLVENADGTLTLSYTTGTATDLEDVDAEDAVVAAYDLLGRPVAADAAGYVILQYASGKAVKVFNN